MNLTIKDILNCTNGKLLVGNINNECENYSRDSRKIENRRYIYWFKR